MEWSGMPVPSDLALPLCVAHHTPHATHHTSHSRGERQLRLLLALPLCVVQYAHHTHHASYITHDTLEASDNCDYWNGDLIYSSGATGAMTYSTKADAVLGDPDAYRET